MFMYWPKVELIALALVWVSNAQSRHFLVNEVRLRWDVNTTRPVGVGNGVFLSPNGDLLLVVSSNGHIQALDAKTGTIQWSHGPRRHPRIKGGVVFGAPDEGAPHAAFCSTNGTSSIVYSLELATGVLLRGTSLKGECTTTPVTTANGTYILATHNVEFRKGIFTVMRTGERAGTALFSYESVANVQFGPVGCFANPVAGNYKGGENNTNDVCIWGLQGDSRVPVEIPRPSRPILPVLPSASFEVTPPVIRGQIFAFQMPDRQPMSSDVIMVGGNRDFLSPHAPMISNLGLSMYWADSRSEQRAWIGERGNEKHYFSTNETGRVTIGNARDAAAAVAPTLSSNPQLPFVIGPTASNQIFRLFSTDFFVGGNVSSVASTSAPVTSRVLISKDDSRAYYATSGPNGTLNCVDAHTLQPYWSIPVPPGVSGDMALSLDGDMLFLVNAVGRAQAYDVASIPPASEVPAPTTSLSVATKTESSNLGYLGFLAVPILGLAIYTWYRRGRKDVLSPNDRIVSSDIHGEPAAATRIGSVNGVVVHREEWEPSPEHWPTIAIQQLEPARPTVQFQSGLPDYKDQCMPIPVGIRLPVVETTSLESGAPLSVSSTRTTSSSSKREGSKVLAAFCTNDESCKDHSEERS